MRLDRLKSHALSFAGTTATVQWGDNLVFKVAGKMFLVLSLDGEVVTDLSIKVSPAEFAALPRESDAFRPAPYLARASWVQLTDPAAIPESELRDRIADSYRLVRVTLPKKLQAALD